MRDETRDSSRTTWPQRVRERWKPVWHAVQWPVLGGLWVVALVLGYIGAGKELAAASKPGPPAELFYRALQLFVLDDSVVVSPPIVSWELAVARFLAPAVAAYTAVQALVAIFREQLQSLRLRRIKNHVVICGLGRKGLQLAQDFHRQADRLVVIEHDEANEYIRYCREEGVIVLLGLDPWHIVLYELAVFPVILFHHSNLQLAPAVDRVVSSVIVTPTIHHLHHSRIVSETDSNYATIFSWWDRLAGTFTRRADPSTIDFGVEGWEDESFQNGGWRKRHTGVGRSL